MVSLFQFQDQAAAEISSKVSNYLDTPAVTMVNKAHHQAPFIQTLSAITGAGKTVVLAEAVSQISDTMPVKPIIMWMSRGKVVVQQTYTNLSSGGRYHHLLDGMTVDVLGNYKPDVVSGTDDPFVYFATVGTFNQRDKVGGSLLIHKTDVDAMEASVWDAIRMRVDSEGRRRPLVVVYDEAQHLTDQQTELLLELDPDGFLLASATLSLPSRIGEEYRHIRNAGYEDDELSTKVRTKDVVAEGLIKDTVHLAGYNTPMEDAVSQLLSDWREASAEAGNLGLEFKPKAIYVTNTNVVADTPNQSDDPKQKFEHRQAPPILIWRYLVEHEGVDPETIAVYANLKTDKSFPLPDEFRLFNGGDNDFDDFSQGDFRHVIFNLTLQEGWDDPSVYFAYVDKSMQSKAQITQVIGRVLRQPSARHYSSARLNTASFYVRVDENEVFNDVIKEVRLELGEDLKGLTIIATSPGGHRPKTFSPRGAFFVPETALDSLRARAKTDLLMDGFGDYRTGGINTHGTGSRRILRQKVGKDLSDGDWEEYEHSSEASARWLFHREVQRQYRPALGVVNLAEAKLDAVIGIGSSAHKQVVALADSTVEAYIQGSRLVQRRLNPYQVGSLLARESEVVPFANSVHEGYSGLNSLESSFAECLDGVGVSWCRNPARSGYGIPLITVGPTSTFYPDFLFWTQERVVCVDTKGPHLVQETARRKLLKIRPPKEGVRLDIQFVSAGSFNSDMELKSSTGFTSWSLGDDGRVRAVVLDSMESVVDALVDDSLHRD